MNAENSDQQQEIEPEKVQTAAQQPKIIDSAVLFENSNEVHISHGEEIYRLLLTRNGKLILNK